VVRFLEHRGRRQAHHPARPEVAPGRGPRRWDRHGRGNGNRAGFGDLTTARQRVPPLRVRSLGRALAMARRHG
jgi:hypothetical protein